MKRVIALLLIIVGLHVVAVGQMLVPKSQFIINVDYARFSNNPQSSYLEVYYELYPKFISYLQSGGKLHGAVRLTTKLTNKATDSILVYQNFIVPVVIDDTLEASMRSTIVSQLGYAVPFGEYSLYVMAFDSLAPARRDSLLLAIKIEAPKPVVSSSDVELCSSIRESKNKDDVFYKNSYEVVPNPMLMYGSTSHPVIYYYLELYGLSSTETYSFTTQIVGANGKVVKESSQKKSFKVKNAVEVGTLNMTSITSGKYVFRVVLADEKGKALVSVQRNFFANNPQIKAPELSAIALGASALMGLSGEELAAEFRKAQYVATPKEIKMFANVTSDEGRREFLAKMWSDIEVGRDGRPPITRDEYLKRIEIANQRYHAMQKDGWKTDRGRVFILYSVPDDIEHIPSGEQSKPYEVWHYNSIEDGVIFVFIDRTGYSDYILVHSTKRGEIQDENWETQTR
jgi:GWxTD domain-containing protein